MMRSPFGIKTAKQKSAAIAPCPPKNLSVVFCNTFCRRALSKSGIMAYSVPVIVPCCTNCDCGYRALNCLSLNPPAQLRHWNEVVVVPPAANRCASSKRSNPASIGRPRLDHLSPPPFHPLPVDLGPVPKVSCLLWPDPD